MDENKIIIFFFFIVIENNRVLVFENNADINVCLLLLEC